MIALRDLQAAVVTAVLLALPAVTPASAAEPLPAPALEISSIATPTNFNPAGGDEPNYEVRINNVGAAATDGSPITITDTLPKGLVVTKVEFLLHYKLFEAKDFGEDPAVCQRQTVAEVTTVTCTLPEELAGSGEESSVMLPSEELRLVTFVGLAGAAEGKVLTNQASVEGGGAPVDAVTSDNLVSTQSAPPGFAEYTAALLGPDGQPLTQAGAHPYQFLTTFSLNSRRTRPGAEEKITPSGGDPKDTPVILPPGLIGNPTATTRCTHQEFTSTHVQQPFDENKLIQFQRTECPDSSVVGYITLRRVATAGTGSTPIFNLTPPPGMPAQLGFTILGLPIFIDTEVRPSENYRVVGVVRNITEAKRVIAAAVSLWGDPAAAINDPIRGNCLNPRPELHPVAIPPGCPAGITNKPFLRLPTSCESSLDFMMGLTTWSNPQAPIFATSSWPAPTGCNLVEFDPTLEARPTTNVADSPSGLKVDLHIPQNEDPTGLGEADARRVTVTFPKGLALNPSGANGLEACSPAQIGLTSKSPVRFDDQPADCPAASRIGSVDVDTPLLDDPLHGSLYVAMPFDNPFDSLLAVYITVNDRERGVVVKLAGHVEPDPQTGQLSTTFDDNPQVPFDDFKLNLFSGALAPLRTPAVCGSHSTTSSMTPWSAPESGPPATPSDTYSIDRSPRGGACPTSEATLPNSPSFDAGTVSPIAGAYSPFVINLRREDGSQEFAAVTVTPPPGLLGKLAGIPPCPDSALAAAAAKTGNAEKANPSCPVASQVGIVDVGAGAGPAPFYAQGKAYLAGPYKGAPVSLAIVTPATAGPYDLGTVVVRTALYVNPATVRIIAVSDPIPHILQGVVLDVRSAAVAINRPGFTLNPTSCDPLAVSGLEVSTLGQSATLSSRFQVGECGALRFKPKLNLRLKGGTKRARHPNLIATLTAKGGEANIARASVALPRSAFLDQAHIRTICTRVQWAAEACPSGSIYGKVSVTSPLVDYPVAGNVYLRSSNNKLPDLVMDLRGPAYQPIRAELAGRTDSVKGALRNTFDMVPDVPVSKFRLELFGGKRGLVVNSRDICAHTYRATVKLTAQNGDVFNTHPAVRNDCGRKHRAHKHG